MPHHGGRRHGTQVPRWLVIHDEEYPLSATSAERIGAYFARTDAPGCAHYCHDSDSTVVCADPREVCWHAPPNSGAVGHERDGYASWTPAQWNQPNAQRTTCRTAANMAANAVQYGIPTLLLGAAELRAGRHGFCTHASRSKAHGQSSHTDPGPHFPLGPFMALVRTAEAWCRDAEAFQLAHGLTVDGIVGPNTLDAMTDALWKLTPGDTPVVPSSGDEVPGPTRYRAEPAAPGALGLWDKGQRCGQVQRALGVHADGFYGLNTEAAVRQYQRAHGLTVDGLVGPRTWASLFPPPPKPVPPSRAPGIVVDGKWGERTTRALQTVLRVKVDGSYGPNTKRALQRHLGVAADGVVGPMTVRALQRRLGVAVDGKLGPQTIKALQRRLNGGTL